MNTTALKPGFSDPVHDAQLVFRNLLNVMSRPGKVRTVNEYVSNTGALNPVMASVVLTLLDYETPFWLSESLNTEEIAHYISFHTGAKKVNNSEDAICLLVGNEKEFPALGKISLGTPEYPDRSSTILLGVPSFNTGLEVKLSGPGIKSETQFASEGLTAGFWKTAISNNSLYPQGGDFFFCSNNAIAALPRSTTIGM